MTDIGAQKASELVGKDFSVVVDGQLHQAAAGGFWQTGVKPVYRVTTRRGHEVKLTMDHRVKRTATGLPSGPDYEWVPVAGLTVGDRIKLSHHIGAEWGSSTDEESKQAYYTGGCLPLSEVPDSIERASSAVYIAFLRGLFDEHACVECSPTQLSGYVKLCYSSLTIVKAAQRMLLRLGVDSCIGDTDTEFPTLRIEYGSVYEFWRRIGFSRSTKQRRLDSLPWDDFADDPRPYFNDEVVSIELVGEEPVYDVTVQGVHEFCANGIQAHNCEIGMLPVTESGEGGFQFCCLSEINGGKCVDKETFYSACETAAILGTLQAGYTNFKYLGNATKEITERESLIGVSITGWMNNPDVLFDEETLKRGAEIVKETNRQVAALIGIRPAARTTCAKPSGNASVLLGTASGIHGEHSPRYLRNVQMSTDSPIANLIAKHNPKMVEKSVWSAGGTDFVISFPVTSKEGSIYKRDLMGVKQLDFVKMAQQNWVEHGTNVELCTDPRLRHNISNTISVDDWDEVEQYLFDNRAWFAGVSLLAASGDKGYAQAPFTEVHTAEEILKMYGDASLFASGLIVEGLHAFNENLWQACDTAMGFGLKLDPEDSSHLLKRDWVRRFHKFAENYFAGDTQQTAFCLKDCFNLHKWIGIQSTIVPVEFSSELRERAAVDVDTMGSQACAGGVCELVF